MAALAHVPARTQGQHAVLAAMAHFQLRRVETVAVVAGLPAHLAIGTNKMSSMVGTAFSCGRFVRSGYVDWGLAVPAAACSLAASVGGARLSMLLPE